MFRYYCFVLILVSTLSLSAFAQLSLPHIFSDHMVIQRDQPVPIWGKADPKEKVTLTFNGKTLNAKADQNGNWEVMLPATVAGGPYTINIQGKSESASFSDVLVGDVFLCGGQSNMEWRVRQLPYANEVAYTANDTQIRLIKVAHDQALQPKDDILPTEWKVNSEENVREFSAVAYFFAQQLRAHLEVPIGLISSNWGGTPAEAWMSAEALSEYPRLHEAVQQLQMEGNTMEKVTEDYRAKTSSFFNDVDSKDPGINENWASASVDFQNWETMLLPSPFNQPALRRHDGSVWFKRSVILPPEFQGKDLLLNLGIIDDEDQVWINDTKVGETQGKDQYRRYKVPASAVKAGENVITVRVVDKGGSGGFATAGKDFYLTPAQQQSLRFPLAGYWYYQRGAGRENYPTQLHHYPSLLYNAMIHPLVPYALKGAIWYQGETNASRAKEYSEIFPAMIQQWRNDWNSEMPFAFVQLANFMAPVETPQPSDWAELREAQTKALELPKVGMATIIDIGEADDIHPANKRDVGKRLALAMREIAYSEDVVASGPTFQSAQVEGSKMIVKLDNIGSGLVVKNKYGYLKGFTLAGSDQEFHWAKAEVTGENEVTVYSDAVVNPVAVRYAWANNPDQANLYNEEGLPAVPFRSDDWEGITEDNTFTLR
ncbi:MAG: sialate O-acetylesterase [Bacteroidota bacterium]